MRRLLILLLFFAIAFGDVCPASAEDGDPVIVSVGAVAADVLCVTIDEGSVTLGELRPYQPEAADQLKEEGHSATKLIRGAAFAGYLTGDSKTQQRFVRTPDSFSGRSIAKDQIANADQWSVRNAGQTLAVDRVFRKSLVRDVADIIDGWPGIQWRHQVFLKLKQTVVKGTLNVANEALGLVSHSIAYDPALTTSHAIHVTQIGFRPNDPIKLAFLSCWMGDGGGVDYAAQAKSTPDVDSKAAVRRPEFAVVDDRNGKIVKRGYCELTTPPDQPCDHTGLKPDGKGGTQNYAGIPVYQADFSSLETPGLYRVVVRNVGSSTAFQISPDVYRPLRDMAIKGLAVHRWGVDDEIELVDGSTMARPAAGPGSHSSSRPIYRSSAGYTNANFDEIVAGKLDPFEGDITGGYMDAGDYDRNFNHHKVAYLLCDAAEKVAVGVHGDSALAKKLVQAARFNLDVFIRTQDADGGVPSAMEYEEHPRKGEPSWLNSLPIFVCAPHAESNLQFVIAAAKTAATMKRLSIEGSKDYLDAAEMAMQWYDANGPLRLPQKGAAEDYQWHALTELWNAGAAQYRQRAIDHREQRMPKPWSIVIEPGIMAALTMIEMDQADDSILDDEVRERLTGAVEKSMEMHYIEGSHRRSSYRVLKNGWAPLGHGGGAWPQSTVCSVMRAAWVLDDQTALSASVAGIAYAAGGNPLNLVYMSGPSPRYIQQVLHCDTRYSGRPAPLGIPIYGPAPGNSPSAWPTRWPLTKHQAIYPPPATWPTYENVHQFWVWAQMTEYTIHQDVAPVIYFACLLNAKP